MPEEILYSKEDTQVYDNVLVLKYTKLAYNRHKYGFDKGVLPLLQQCSQKGIDSIILDLEDITHIESMTLGSIIKFWKQIQNSGIPNLRFLNATTYVKEVIKTQNLEKIFGTPYSSLEDALKELKK